MGSVWAVRLKESGSWMALKAIPIELSDSGEESLQTALRECLSTFGDLNTVHVVRYESYWIEEAENLPVEFNGKAAMERDSSSSGSTLPEPDCLEAPSLRFGADAREVSEDFGFMMTPVSREDAGGFVWESDSCSSPASPEAKTWRKSFRKPRHEEKILHHGPETALMIPPGLKHVVLLIEMVLMGPAPGESITSEERLTLRMWLERDRTLSGAADAFCPLMASVRYIHRKRLVHSDLKPDNVFCTVRQNRVCACKIGDFGLAGENQLSRDFCYGERRRRSVAGGTPGYTAPEISKRVPAIVTEKADIYACGVMLLELLLPPCKTLMERVKALEMFATQELPLFVKAKLPKTWQLLKEMSEKDPLMRPSAEEVCKRLEKEVRKELCRSQVQHCVQATRMQVRDAPKLSHVQCRGQGAAKQAPCDKLTPRGGRRKPRCA